MPRSAEDLQSTSSVEAVSASIDRVKQVAADAGLEIDVVSFPEGTKTAAQAADAVGAGIGEIVKSLVFAVDGEPVVALVPGDRRLDTGKLGAIAGSDEPASRVSLDGVRSATGFVAGGTPPFAHGLRVYADHGLRRFDRVWAAAGTPHTVFQIQVDDLDRIAAPVWGDLSET